MIKKFLAIFMFSSMLIGCEKELPPPGPGPGTIPDPTVKNVNDWILGYMNARYLWNEGLEGATFDNTLKYDNFLVSMLDKVGSKNNMNQEDGYWKNGKRAYYYSYIKKTPVNSKSDKSDYTSSGCGISTGSLGSNPLDGTITLHVGGIEPGSQAYLLGMQRGDIVTKVNGISYPESEANAFIDHMNKFVFGTVSEMAIEWGKPVISKTGSYIGVENLKSAVFTSTTFQTSPIWKHNVMTTSNGKKVGYLNYNEFNLAFDDDLIGVFAGWKTLNVSEIVLDFRNNGGGHVVSSAVIATALAGVEHENDIFMKSIYNKARMAPGDLETEYRFGDSAVPGGEYTPIHSALMSSLSGIKTVYVLCSNGTASASEAVINGLRGVDIDVRLIGKTTNGKNVGMEPLTKVFNGESYELVPITFYIENAKGFNDYSTGFIPDVIIDEDKYLPLPYGDPNEVLYSIALSWIKNGSKPVITKSAQQIVQTKLGDPKPRAMGMIQVDLSK